MRKRTSDRPRTVFRRVDGILLLDKPAGMSSNQALQRVRHLIRAEKGGHTGALDPLATGLLPLCFGEATKIAGLLLGASKAYRTVARLGVTTDTDDADGLPLVQRPVQVLDRARVEVELARFRGRIRQRPPAYSALKRDGEPLYAKARRGEQVVVEEREAQVFELRLLDLEADRLSLEIECGSGTYVRSLVRDLGERLGCGAHVEQLRRSWVAPFLQPRMVTLAEVAELAEAGDAALGEHILPIELGLAGMPRVDLDPEQVTRLRHGQRIDIGGPPLDVAVAFGANGIALGLVEVEAGGIVRVRRLFAAPEPTSQSALSASRGVPQPEG